MASLPQNDSIVDDAYIEVLHGFLSRPPVWMEEGNCVGMESARTDEEILEACKDCAVIEQCLKYASDNDVSSGVFGGRVFPLDNPLSQARVI